MPEQQIHQESGPRAGAVQIHVPPSEGAAWNPASWRSPPWTSASAWSPWSAAAAWTPASGTPKCDIADEGTEFVCELELPGVRVEDVEVVCFERALLVDARRSPTDEGHGGVLLRSERGVGLPVRRTIVLPQEVRPSGVTAALRDGVLTVRMPKAEPTDGPARIDVAP